MTWFLLGTHNYCQIEPCYTTSPGHTILCLNNQPRFVFMIKFCLVQFLSKLLLPISVVKTIQCSWSLCMLPWPRRQGRTVWWTESPRIKYALSLNLRISHICQNFLHLIFQFCQILIRRLKIRIDLFLKCVFQSNLLCYLSIYIYI